MPRSLDPQMHPPIAEQQQLNKLFDLDELENYFMQVQGRIPIEILEMVGDKYEGNKREEIGREIRRGRVQVGDRRMDLGEQYFRHRIGLEEEKEMELKARKEQIQKRLKYLDMQTSVVPKSAYSLGINPEVQHQAKSVVLSKEEHQAYIEKVKRAREELDKKHREMISKLQRSIKQEQSKLKQMKSEKSHRQKQARRNSIEKKLELKRQQHQKALEEQKHNQQQYSKVKNKQFLHQRLEAKYQSEIELPALQQKKRKLKQIREISKAFNVQQLRRHQKQYLEQKHSSSLARSKADDDWNYKPPEKTEKLKRVLQEQKLQQKKALQQSKRQIEEKLQRQQNFLEYLKEQFKPKIDESKVQEIKQRIVRQQSKKKSVLIDPKTLGISYLQQIKQRKRSAQTIKKKSENSTEKESRSSQKQAAKPTTDYLITNRKDKAFYLQERRKRLQKLINADQLPGYQKIKELQKQSHKISSELQRRQQLAKAQGQDIKHEDEAVQLLLSNIQAKMGIISLYNCKSQPS